MVTSDPHKRMGELPAKARKDHETHPWLVPGDEALKRAPVRPTPPRRFAWPSPPILAMLVALGLAVVVWLYAGASAKAVEAMRNAPDVYGLEGRP